MDKRLFAVYMIIAALAIFFGWRNTKLEEQLRTAHRRIIRGDSADFVIIRGLEAERDEALQIANNEGARGPIPRRYEQDVNGVITCKKMKYIGGWEAEWNGGSSTGVDTSWVPCGAAK